MGTRSTSSRAARTRGGQGRRSGLASPRPPRTAQRATTWGELIAALVELCGDDRVAVQTAAALVQRGRIHAPDGTPWTLD